MKDSVNTHLMAHNDNETDRPIIIMSPNRPGRLRDKIEHFSE
jgi:hypothetical protein